MNLQRAICMVHTKNFYKIDYLQPLAKGINITRSQWVEALLGLGVDLFPSQFCLNDSHGTSCAITVKSPIKEELWQWMSYFICRTTKLWQWGSSENKLSQLTKERKKIKKEEDGFPTQWLLIKHNLAESCSPVSFRRIWAVNIQWRSSRDLKIARILPVFLSFMNPRCFARVVCGTSVGCRLLCRHHWGHRQPMEEYTWWKECWRNRKGLAGEIHWRSNQSDAEVMPKFFFFFLL